MKSAHEKPPSAVSASKTAIVFTVYETEPLVRLLASFRWVNPVTLILAFYLVVTVPLLVWSAFTPDPKKPGYEYVSFFENLSWPVSMIFLFPFAIGLTLGYYRSIPRLFDYLVQAVLESRQDREVEDFARWLRRRFNTWIVPLSALVVALVLNAIYVRQLLQHPEHVFWGTSGHLLARWLGTPHGLSWIGVYGTIVLVALTYWMVNLVWRGFVLAWGLFEFFNRRRFSIRLEPLHPDGACGLRPIGAVVARLNVILFLLGIYLSLKIIDKMIIQSASLSEDLGNPIMLTAYAVVSPLLFFLPLGAAHRSMLEAKNRFLQPICKACQEYVVGLKATGLENDVARLVDTLGKLERLREDLKKKIPVWPFDFRTLQAFFATLVVPLLPVLLPLVIKLALDR